MKVKPLSRAELLALPPATDLPTLGRAFGISEPVARERNLKGDWKALGIRVNRLGLQYRVVTADILRALGIDQGIVPVGQLSPTTDVGSSNATRNPGHGLRERERREAGE